MKTDLVLQKEVEDAILREPLLGATAISITTIGGIVRLSGNISSYAKKMETENIVKKVIGVQSIISDIEVLIRGWDQKNDKDITAEVLNAFRWNWNTLNDTINVEVENGWVTLSGTLEWNYQKEAAKIAVGNLIGVKGITNNIIITANRNIEVNKLTIERALWSHVDLDVTYIEVLVSGSNVTLKGNAESSYQKELAGRIAWKAPGVLKVDNELLVQYE